MAASALEPWEIGLAAVPTQQSFLQAARHFAAGRVEEAEVTCQKLLERNARYVPALQLMSEIYAGRGQLDEASRCAETSLEAGPTDAICWLVVGQVRRRQHRYDEAIEHFDRGLELAPQHHAVVAGKADLLEFLGRDDEAQALLDSTPDVVRLKATAAIVAAKLALRRGDFEAAIEIARPHLEDSSTERNPRWNLLFSVGKAHERAGRFDEAFDAYFEANGVFTNKFSTYDHESLVNDLIKVFTPETLAARPEGLETTDLPVFIVGMPRSGTSLTEKIIASHPDAYGAGELSFFWRLALNIMYELNSLVPYPRCAARIAAPKARSIVAPYIEQLRTLGGDAKRVVDKLPHNFLCLGLISQLLPGARVIHCRRDPLDTCVSCFTQPLDPRMHPWSARLETCGFCYRQYERLMEHWREVLPLQMLEVQYERLIDDPEVETRRIIDFCGLPWDERCLRFYESRETTDTLSYEQVRRPMYTTSIGRWKQFEHRLGPLQEALGAPS